MGHFVEIFKCFVKFAERLFSTRDIPVPPREPGTGGHTRPTNTESSACAGDGCGGVRLLHAVVTHWAAVCWPDPHLTTATWVSSTDSTDPQLPFLPTGVPSSCHGRVGRAWDPPSPSSAHAAPVSALTISAALSTLERRALDNRCSGNRDPLVTQMKKTPHPRTQTHQASCGGGCGTHLVVMVVEVTPLLVSAVVGGGGGVVPGGGGAVVLGTATPAGRLL